MKMFSLKIEYFPLKWCLNCQFYFIAQRPTVEHIARRSPENCPTDQALSLKSWRLSLLNVQSK